MSRCCINCSANFFNGACEAVNQISIALDSNSDDSSELDQSISILDALTCIFPVNQINQNLLILAKGEDAAHADAKMVSVTMDTDGRSPIDISCLLMCMNCATVLSTLYEAYFQLLQLSQMNSQLAQWVQQIQIWHSIDRDSHSARENIPDSLSNSNLSLDLITTYISALRNDLSSDPAVKMEFDEIVTDDEYLYSNPIDFDVPGPEREHKVMDDDNSKQSVDSGELRRSLRNRNRELSQSQTLPVIVKKPSQSVGKKAKASSVRRVSTPVKLKKAKKSSQSKIAGSKKHNLKRDAQKLELKELRASPLHNYDHEFPLPEDECDEDDDLDLLPRNSTKSTRNRLPKNHKSRNQKIVFKQPKEMENRISTNSEPEVLGPESPGLLRKCPYENCSFKYQKHKLSNHYRNAHKNVPRPPQKIFACPNAGCEVRLLGANRIRNHVKRMHGEESWKRTAPVTCPDCGKVYTKQSYAHHKKVHQGQVKSFCCEVCGKVFTRNFSLMMHQGSHYETRKYQCPICKLGFKLPNTLRRHYKSKAHPRELVEHLINQKIRPNADVNVLGPIVKPTRVKSLQPLLWAGGSPSQGISHGESNPSMQNQG